MLLAILQIVMGSNNHVASPTKANFGPMKVGLAIKNSCSTVVHMPSSDEYSLCYALGPRILHATLHILAGLEMRHATQ